MKGAFLLLASLALAGAFSTTPTLSAFKPSAIATCDPLTAQLSPSIAKPKVEVGNQVYTQKPEAGKPKIGKPKVEKKNKTQDDETPMYKVILLGDAEYEQSHVVTQITKVIPSVKKEEAIRCFVEAQMTGTSVIIVVTEEHAEHYAQQLKRQQIYAKIEKDE